MESISYHVPDEQGIIVGEDVPEHPLVGREKKLLPLQRAERLLDMLLVIRDPFISSHSHLRSRISQPRRNLRFASSCFFLAGVEAFPSQIAI